MTPVPSVVLRGLTGHVSSSRFGQILITLNVCSGNKYGHGVLSTRQWSLNSECTSEPALSRTTDHFMAGPYFIDGTIDAPLDDQRYHLGAHLHAAAKKHYVESGKLP